MSESGKEPQSPVPGRGTAAVPTEAMVALLWQRFQPLVISRLEVLERFAAGEQTDKLDAGRAAHNLAGSLGSYGHPEGSAIARELDLALSSDQIPSAAWLRERVTALRRSVGL